MDVSQIRLENVLNCLIHSVEIRCTDFRADTRIMCRLSQETTIFSSVQPIRRVLDPQNVQLGRRPDQYVCAE